MAGAEDQMSIVVTIIDLLKSGNSTIVLLLVLIALCAYFGWERFQMQKQLNEKILADRQMLLDVIDKYREGQMDVVEALNELRVVLARIEGKIL
jgi:uncharacterized protein YbgA (DUF1722 family)